VSESLFPISSTDFKKCMSNPKYTNELVHEKSPYLLQHAHNPVNWRPWGDEAFEIAKEANKPVLVSIGYATCHWCHVMERESFENEETAKIMNENFVCIKVDREERPDVDSVYMKSLQTLGQQGGWPLNVFVTPAGIPFYGGTYFPPEGRYGMSSFQDVLKFLLNIWHNEHEKVEKQGKAISEALKDQFALEKAGDKDSLSFDGEERTVKLFESSFDNINAGFKFQQQNKFPPSMGLSFLLRYHRRTGHLKSLEMTQSTLRAMKHGGIYDQIGGGLSRYSTDYRWLVPHFEKMMYDNALFAITLIETFQTTGQQEFAEWACDVFQYIDRDMTSPEGGFYSAEDADSEGVEGKFYVWTLEEVQNILGRETASIVVPYYNVTEQGNFEKKNILNVQQTISQFAKEKGFHIDQVKERLQEAREKLLEVRGKRIRPLLDDKILASWNGLAITAFAKAGRVLENEDLIGKAEKSCQFIFDKLTTPEGRLLRRYREGEAKYDAYLCDYASVSLACLELYEATYNPDYLNKARNLMTVVAEKFAADNGAFYETAEDAEKLIVRQLTGYDGVEPSGNSAAAMAFLKLSAYEVDPEWEKKGLGILMVFQEDLMEYGLNSPFMMQAAHFFLGGAKEVAVIGKRNDPSTEEFLATIRTGFFPQATFAFAFEDEIATTPVKLLQDRKLVDGKATAYVCRRGTCLAPVTTVKELQALLDDDYKEG